MFVQPLIMPILPSLIIGLLALVVGGVPLAIGLGLIPLAFTMPPMVSQIVLVLVGFLMLLDSLLGFSMS